MSLRGLFIGMLALPSLAWAQVDAFRYDETRVPEV